MKIKSIEIENFRAFRQVKISLNDYTCLVGPNGVGKSTVLSALNVFFQNASGSFKDPSTLTRQDFYQEVTESPIRISVEFIDISDEARRELKAYVRQDRLIVTAEAEFDKETSTAPVIFRGLRLGIEDFRPFFDALKDGKKVAELRRIYDELRTIWKDVPAKKTKQDMEDALRVYEEAHPGHCIEIPSEDQFYGVNSKGKLAQFVQWVYVPAVKDASEEGQEGRNTALSLLVNRAVADRTELKQEFDTLRLKVVTQYEALVKRQAVALESLSQSLRSKLASWAHPGIQLEMTWSEESDKTVRIDPPVAEVKAGEGKFLGQLDRMGHGLQRSYLLALLQELSEIDGDDAPTLILACEEPELYQHPPQARHLADVFTQLTEGNAQVMVTTHSPFFVNGEGFENVRLVRKSDIGTATVHGLAYKEVLNDLQSTGYKHIQGTGTGTVAKIHQILQARVCEMFFARCPVLVEGPEDVSYLTTALHVAGRWNDFRAAGCHFIPVNGKQSMLAPLAISKRLGLPAFTIFDADATCKQDKRKGHEEQNSQILSLLQSDVDPFPTSDQFREDHIVWREDVGKAVESDIGKDVCKKYKDQACVRHDMTGGLGKNDLFIADWLTQACEQEDLPQVLKQAVDAILDFATAQSNMADPANGEVKA